jgi:uncharacterized repeat protein (TIGR03803 family)
MKRNSTLRMVSAALLITTGSVLLPGIQAAGKYQTLHKLFAYSGGVYSSAGLTFDAAGNLYGTTQQGGNISLCGGGGCGTVFMLAPDGNGKWVYHVLYSFTGFPDGQDPVAGLIVDKNGTLYGTTSQGGGSSYCPNGCGTVFALMRNHGKWTEQVVYTFNGKDGASPVASLIHDARGNLYGTTSGLGTSRLSGTVFELMPESGGTWKEKTLHKFTGGIDGGEVLASLIFDSAGNLFGTTAIGGAHREGTVFELMPESDGSWKEKVLYSFTGSSDGGGPSASLVFDSTGNLYGTAGGGTSQAGVVFRLTPKAGGSWQENVLHQFTGNADGAYPSNLIFDTIGNLYSTTLYGGDNKCDRGCGVVFRLEPGSKGSWHETVLHSFSDSPGANSFAGVIFDAVGNLYGTTYGDGYQTRGSVFNLTP